MNIEGKVWKFGDHVDTDLIIPARYLSVHDGNELAKHCFEDLRPEFPDLVSNGDIIVGGSNFGCGSSREHAPLTIKAVGIGAIIAKSYARIFYRNAFNIGLPILESPDAANALAEGDRIDIDLEKGIIKVIQNGKQYTATPIPEFMRGIVDAGGLVNYVKGKDLNN